MGRIVGIKRFEIHDGDGIRTTVFLKGCPLECRWCHNPECISPKPQLAFLEKKCLDCGECTKICPAHTMKDGKHVYNPGLCTACGKCSPICLGEALRFYGEEISVDDLMPKLLEDRPFFESSGGGVTVSGGEPLMQSEFVKEILTRLKREGINTALDTCGFVPKETMASVIGLADTFLLDIKGFDERKHILATGRPNGIILENLRMLNERGASVEIRIPFVPKYNGDQIDSIGKMLGELTCIKRVKLLPYHDFGNSKYSPIGRTPEVMEIPTEDEIQTALAELRKYGLNVEDGRE